MEIFGETRSNWSRFKREWEESIWRHQGEREDMYSGIIKLYIFTETGNGVCESWSLTLIL